jgi:hypothetical protein
LTLIRSNNGELALIGFDYAGVLVKPSRLDRPYFNAETPLP